MLNKNRNPRGMLSPREVSRAAAAATRAERTSRGSFEEDLSTLSTTPARTSAGNPTWQR